MNKVKVGRYTLTTDNESGFVHISHEANLIATGTVEVLEKDFESALEVIFNVAFYGKVVEK